MKSKISNFKKNLSAFSVISLAIMLMLTGCKKEMVERSLLDTVPADARFIATVNFEKLLKNSGCKFNNGVITLSQPLADLRDQLPRDKADMVNTLLLTAQTIDITNIVLFEVDNLNPVVTFNITQPEIFAGLATAASRKIESMADYQVYDLSDCVLMTVDGQGWISRSATDIEQSVGKAVDNGSGQISNGVANFLLDAAPAVSAAVNLSTSADLAARNGVKQTLNNVWLCSSATVNNNILGLETKAIGEDGQALDVSPYVSTLNYDFLRYVPDNTQLLFALGHVSGLNDLFDSLSPYLSASMRNDISKILPYLQAIDGTMAIAVNPASSETYLSDFSLSTWDATLLANMPQKTSDALVGMISLYAANSGTSRSHDNINAIEFDDAEIQYGCFDDFFIASTREISANNNNSFASTVQGKLGAFIVDIPYRSASMTALGWPYGFHCSLTLSATSLNGKLMFNGTGEPFLLTLASVAAKTINRIPAESSVAESDSTDIALNDPAMIDNLQPIE